MSFAVSRFCNINHRMQSYKNLLLCLATLLLMSCSGSGIMQDVKVKLSSPENVVSLVPDSTFHSTFSEVLNPLRLQIVDDTLLVVQEPVNAANTCHFKVYSLNDFSYLGAIAHNGRGPGEMISPYVVRNCSDTKCLNVIQNQTAEVYSINVSGTIKTGGTVVSYKRSLPVGTVDCLPLKDSCCLYLQSENGRLSIRTVGDDGVETCAFKYSEGCDDENHIPHLSSLFVGNPVKGEAAQIMMFFPQLNILDTEKGTLESIAVDKSYRNWSSITSGMIGMETTQYYMAATASQDYIFAVYKGMHLSELVKGGQGSSIHVFDWSGNFLYDIAVQENVADIAYDARTQNLYCIEKSEGRIIRYNFGGKYGHYIL